MQVNNIYTSSLIILNISWSSCNYLYHLRKPDQFSILDRVFATHGIPESMNSDNRPPNPSKESEKYVAEKGFQLTPMSSLSSKHEWLCRKFNQITANSSTLLQLRVNHQRLSSKISFCTIVLHHILPSMPLLPKHCSTWNFQPNFPTFLWRKITEKLLEFSKIMTEKNGTEKSPWQKNKTKTKPNCNRLFCSNLKAPFKPEP